MDKTENDGAKANPGSFEMKLSKQILNNLAFLLLTGGLLAACKKDEDVDQSGLPAQVIDQMDTLSRENLTDASYQIHKYGSVKAYVVELPEGFCGSGGCQTFIIVEKGGKVQKLYQDLAEYVNVKAVYPDQFRFEIGRSGVMCGKPSNASECHWIRTWPKGSTTK